MESKETGLFEGRERELQLLNTGYNHCQSSEQLNQLWGEGKTAQLSGVALVQFGGCWISGRRALRGQLLDFGERL